MPDFQLDPNGDDQQVLAQIVGYYQTTLKSSQDALDYLQSRGIVHNEAIDHFRLGYSDRSLGLQLPRKEVKAGAAIRSRLTQLGVYRDTGHEHFCGSITVPIFAGDGTGRIMDIYGRKTRSDLRKGTPLDTYLGNERCGVWNIDGFAGTDEIIVCGTIFDGLLFWVNGYRNVTCTFGTLPDDHLSALAEFKIKRVLVSVDTFATKIMDAGVDCYKLALPHDLDPGASNLAEVLEGAIRKAEWLGKGHSPTKLTSAVIVTPAPPPPAPVPELPPVRHVTPLPPAPADLDAEVTEDQVQIVFGDRRYRVRGWSKNLSFDQLRVNIMASNCNGLFIDSFDLYAAKHRKTFVVQAATELGVDEQTVKNDIGRVLLKLEELQDQNIEKTLTPKEVAPQMTNAERDEALQLLRDPHLLDRIVADFDIVGERTNKLVGYLAVISRKLDEPLAVIIQSMSAAGKTSLMDATLSMMPPEDLVRYSAMTGQSLFYMGESNLKHKVLSIAEGEGAERVTYALKLLQSEGELTIASTGKDATSGRLVTQEYRVCGPVMIFLTTTAIKIDEEMLNRCIVLSVDEDREQTRAIHQVQRRRQTLEGHLAQHDRQERLTLHRNAQRLLRPLLVVNPFAEVLTFIDNRTRTRRDHAKYLTLMKTVALLRQHQRPIKTVDHHGQQLSYIEITLEDIAVTNQLAREVLGRSLDELPPQTRRLLDLIDSMVTTICQRKKIERGLPLQPA